MKSLREIEEVGWVFYGIVFAILAPGSVYLSYQYTFSSVSSFIRVGAGIFAAAMAAGVVAMIVNELLQRRAARRNKERRKVERKKKRKGK